MDIEASGFGEEQTDMEGDLDSASAEMENTERNRTFTEKAIQSLECLNDQIVENIFRPRNGEISYDTDLPPKHQDTLKSSMVLIRRLLYDAQSKFRKMEEDSKKLAARIDGSINAAEMDVNSLRAELLDTNKKLTEISEITESTPLTTGLWDKV